MHVATGLMTIAFNGVSGAKDREPFRLERYTVTTGDRTVTIRLTVPTVEEGSSALLKLVPVSMTPEMGPSRHQHTLQSGPPFGDHMLRSMVDGEAIGAVALSRERLIAHDQDLQEHLARLVERAGERPIQLMVPQAVSWEATAAVLSALQAIDGCPPCTLAPPQGPRYRQWGDGYEVKDYFEAETYIR